MSSQDFPGTVGCCSSRTDGISQHAFFIDALNNSITSVRTVRNVYVCIVGPYRPQEKFCSIVFTLQEGLWTAQCLDVGQNGPAKARSIVLYLEAPGLFLFLLLNSVDIVRGRRGRLVYVRPVCVFARAERRGRALRVGTEEIAGPPFPPWLFAVSDPTAIKIAFFAERLGKLGKWSS